VVIVLVAEKIEGDEGGPGARKELVGRVARPFRSRPKRMRVKEARDQRESSRAGRRIERDHFRRSASRARATRVTRRWP